MSSIVVGADPRADDPAPLVKALKRAVPERASQSRRESLGRTKTLESRAAVSEAMEILVTTVVFGRSKTQVRDEGKPHGKRMM